MFQTHVSSLRRGHADLLCIVPSLRDGPRVPFDLLFCPLVLDFTPESCCGRREKQQHRSLRLETECILETRIHISIVVPMFTFRLVIYVISLRYIVSYYSIACYSMVICINTCYKYSTMNYKHYMFHRWTDAHPQFGATSHSSCSGL